MSMASDLLFMLGDAPGAADIVADGVPSVGVFEEQSEAFDAGDGRLAVRGLQAQLLYSLAELPLLAKGLLVHVTPRLPAFSETRTFKVSEVTKASDGSGTAYLVKP